MPKRGREGASLVARGREISATWWDVQTRCGPLGRKVALEQRGGGSFEWHYASPQALFTHFAESVSPFGDLIREISRTKRPRPDSPWSIVLYFDEITPGSPLDISAKRKKVWAVYWSFREFPLWFLQDVSSWFLFGVLRSTEVEKTNGRLSGVCAHVLRTFAIGPHNFPNAGVSLHIGGECIKVFARVNYNLSDGDAHKRWLDVKGSAGLKPCLHCRTCVKRASGIDDPAFVDITCTDVSRFTPCTDQDMFDSADLLAARAEHISEDEFCKLETNLGFNHNPHGILLALDLRPFLRPSSMVMWDPMHIYFSDGIFQLEVELLLGSLKRNLKITSADVEEYVHSGWCWPNKCKLGKGLFTETKFRGKASNVLNIYEILREFATHVLAGHVCVQSEVCSFQALCHVFDAIRLGKQGRCPASLGHRIRDHFNKFKVAYGNDRVIPKQHWALHLPRQILEWGGAVIDCWTDERKNKDVKAIARLICNTRILEKSVGMRMVADAAEKLETMAPITCLSPGPVYRHVRSFGTNVHSNDVILLTRGRVGVAIGSIFVDASNTWYVKVRLGTLQDRRTAVSARWSVGSKETLVAADEVLSVCVYTREGDLYHVLELN